MKNSSQTQHHRSETEKKEEPKIEEIARCRMQVGSREQWNSNRRMQHRGIVNFAMA